jgi:hypothetical protein
MLIYLVMSQYVLLYNFVDPFYLFWKQELLLHFFIPLGFFSGIEFITVLEVLEKILHMYTVLNSC